MNFFLFFLHFFLKNHLFAEYYLHTGSKEILAILPFWFWNQKVTQWRWCYTRFPFYLNCYFAAKKTLPNIIAFSRLILFKRVVSRQNTADGNWYPLKYSKRRQIHLSRQVWTTRTTIYQNKEILRCFSTENFMLNISGTHFSIHLPSILSCYNTCTHALMHRTDNRRLFYFWNSILFITNPNWR